MVPKVTSSFSLLFKKYYASSLFKLFGVDHPQNNLQYAFLNLKSNGALKFYVLSGIKKNLELNNQSLPRVDR